METLNNNLDSLKQEILKRQKTLSQGKERDVNLQHEKLSEVLPVFQSVKNEIFNCQNPDVAIANRALKISEEKGRVKEISALGLTVRFVPNDKKDSYGKSGESDGMYSLKFQSVKDWEVSIQPTIDDWRHIDNDDASQGVFDVSKVKEAIINHLANKLQPLTESFPEATLSQLPKKPFSQDYLDEMKKLHEKAPSAPRPKNLTEIPEYPAPSKDKLQAELRLNSELKALAQDMVTQRYFFDQENVSPWDARPGFPLELDPYAGPSARLPKLWEARKNKTTLQHSDKLNSADRADFLELAEKRGLYNPKIQPGHQ